ncbi:MAG: hypothetical protein ACFFDS_07420 [Candidatus Thorarchaeota archaeon]
MLDLIGQIVLLSFTFSSLAVIVLVIILPIKISNYSKIDKKNEHKEYLLKLFITMIVSVAVLVLTSCFLFVFEWFY